MRALDLDFAHQRTRTPGWARALLVLGVAALLAAGWRHATLRADLEAEQQRTAATSTLSTTAAGDSAPPSAALLREMAKANQAIASLNVPWSQLFTRLESLKVPHVNLLSVQPDASEGRRLRIVAEARQLTDAVAFAQHAAATAGFNQVHLVSHETVSDGDRTRLRFALTLDWVNLP